MSETDAVPKCCGTCKHFCLQGFIKLANDSRITGVSVCLCPVPPCFRFEPYIRPEGGADCPCYEIKEELE